MLAMPKIVFAKATLSILGKLNNKLLVMDILLDVSRV
jgi:hypothetical protein